jgi:hypothetical protein
MRAAFANGCCEDDASGEFRFETLFVPAPASNLRQTADFIQTGHATNREERIAFSGPGLAYYRKTMRVALFEGRAVNADGNTDEPAWREPEI